VRDLARRRRPRICHYVGKAIDEQQKDNVGVTDRGHALTIDSGWREVADTSLAFIQRFV
jgi:non-heme chloroperoxidase